MARTYKSPIDGKVFKTIEELEKYTKDNHMDKIPKNYGNDYIRYLYDQRNGKNGKCRICGAPTKWIPEKKKYKMLCEPVENNSRNKKFMKGKANSCQDQMRKYYVENIKNSSYNTDNLMADIGYQQMLLSNRKIAKKVKFKNNEMTVLGSLEARFVEICNKVLKSDDDLQAPGPTVIYFPKGSNVFKYTICDFYIKSINCIVSIKDGGYNNESHPNIVKKRLNDSYKFLGMVKDKKYDAVIELNGEKEVDEFGSLYKKIKSDISKNKRYIKYPFYYYNHITI